MKEIRKTITTVILTLVITILTPNLLFAATTTTKTYGAIDAASTGFLETQPVGSIAFDQENQEGNIRGWIGHSTCGICGSGITKKQSLVFNNLNAGDTVIIDITTWFVSPGATFTAVADGGTITQGTTSTLPAGHAAGAWHIEATATGPTLTVTVGNNLTAGVYYLYLDSIKATLNTGSIGNGEGGSGGESIWSVLTNNLYYLLGNVGIGTSNPSEKLEVVGTIKATMLKIGSVLFKETQDSGFCIGDCGDIN